MTEIIKDYEIAEYLKHEKNVVCSLFDLTLEQLIYEKMYMLFEVLNDAEHELFNSVNDYEDKRNELLKTIDFKKELSITTKPTIADKEAVMKPKLTEYYNQKLNAEKRVTFCKNKLTIINDLEKQKRLLLRIEGALSE